MENKIPETFEQKIAYIKYYRLYSERLLEDMEYIRDISDMDNEFINLCKISDKHLNFEEKKEIKSMIMEYIRNKIAVINKQLENLIK